MVHVQKTLKATRVRDTHESDEFDWTDIYIYNIYIYGSIMNIMISAFWIFGDVNSPFSM